MSNTDMPIIPIGRFVLMVTGEKSVTKLVRAIVNVFRGMIISSTKHLLYTISAIPECVSDIKDCLDDAMNEEIQNGLSNVDAEKWRSFTHTIIMLWKGETTLEEILAGHL
jgi:hypothetical protein